MRSRLRVWLPIVQLAIAIALITSNRLQDRLESPSWIKPDRQICDGLNAPASLVRFCLLKVADREFQSIRWIDSILETVVYFALVWTLWYLVSIEISGRNRKGPSALGHEYYGPNLRTAIDVRLIAFGGALAVVGQLVRHQFGGLPDLYANLVSVPYFLWAIVIVAFYGRDLWVYRSRKWRSTNWQNPGG
ncbi:MAG TPA: hypothetical protein VFE61_20410 [Candidatus Sulfotelmatobacter sp.]|nr:hypothetical protein [Candidatus Sulfotelmatobacter sp.]